MANTYSYSYGNDTVYCYPNSNVLRNKQNIKDVDELAEFERNTTAIRATFFETYFKKYTLNFNLLKRIHQYLFQDVYDWAGKVRSVDIAKGNMFCRTFAIESEAERIFTELKNENYLKNCPESLLAKRFAYYFSEINALHPFREGNGRTQRIFLNIMAKQMGYYLDFDEVSEDEMVIASYESFNRELDKMESLMSRIIKK